MYMKIYLVEVAQFLLAFLYDHGSTTLRVQVQKPQDQIENWEYSDDELVCKLYCYLLNNL